MSTLAHNLQRILNTLPQGVTLVAVSKTKPVQLIREAYDAGQRHFGENKAQELVSKAPQMPEDVKWHFIGHLQRNKVKQVLPHAWLIHSADSLRLLSEIDKQAVNLNSVARVLLQVHIAQEEHKFGFLPDDLRDQKTLKEISQFNHVQVCGLMGMATFTENEAQILAEFAALKALFHELKPHFTPAFTELSMGMSGDYHLALKHQSTLVRIGSSIFGERNSH